MMKTKIKNMEFLLISESWLNIIINQIL